MGARERSDMTIPYPSKNQWRVLWAAWLIFSFLWTSDADRFSSALGVFGAPVLGLLALLLLWKYGW
jgi:hypothetical protein